MSDRLRVRWAWLLLAALCLAAPVRAQGDPLEALLAELEAAPATERLAVARRAVASWEDVDPVTRAGRLARIADHLYEVGDPAACGEILRLVPDLEAVPPDRALLDATSYLAQLDYAVGDLPRARRHQELAVAAARELGLDAERVDLLQTLGYIAYAQEDNAAAAHAWREALDWLEADPGADPATIVWLQSDLAEAVRLLGDTAAAEALQRAAVARARRDLPRDRNLAVLLNNLGVLLWDQSRLGEGELILREAMEISREHDDPVRVALAHMNLGLILREQGKLAGAEELLARALELARAAVPRDDPRFAYFLVDLARVYFLTDRWDEALPLLREAKENLEAATPVRSIYLSRVLAQIGEGSLRAGHPAAARDAFARSQELRESALDDAHPLVGESMLGRARAVLALEGPGSAQASTLLTGALARLGGGTAREPEAEAHALLARVQWSTGERDAALVSMRRALDLVELLRPDRGGADLSRARFLERFAEYGHDLVAWLVETDAAATALDLAERFRARVLSDQLAAARVDLRAGIPADVLADLEQQERNARVRISAARRALDAARGASTGGDSDHLLRLERDLDAAARALRDAQDRMRSRSPAWQTLARTMRPARLEDVRAVLGPERALLFYAVGPERAFGFLVDAQQLHAFEVTERSGQPLGAEGLHRLARGLDVPPALQVAGQTRGVGGVAPEVDGGGPREARFARLADALAPSWIREALRAHREVVIVPDAGLHALPFEALVTGPGRYWLDEGPPLRYAHSLATLVALARREPVTTDGVVTLSDPDFGDRESFLPRLPGTAEESAAIVAAFAGRPTAVLQGVAATESAVRTTVPSARYVHLATHGLVDESGSELLAALALASPAGGEAEDGMLHLFEIYELDLHCDLAVLSACETKRGLEIRGEGVFALSRGFLTAGARQTIASLWAVSDASTATLMGELFRHIAREGDGSLARGLRDAKRGLREDPRWADPFYWAPFVLTGVQ